MHAAPPDDELIAATARGEHAAFALLFERHARGVLAVARALAPEHAEDVVQETFASALRAIGTYRPGEGGARSWLFAITRNAARRTHRRAREVSTDPSDETSLLELGRAAGWGHDAEDALGRLEDAERIARAIASLAAEEREVVLLRDVERLEGEETAALLGLSLAAMKSRLHRARLRLMAALRADEGGVMANQREVGGLSCSAVLARLGDYVDGDLSTEDVAQVNAHLAGCTVCERFGGRYATVVHNARERLGAKHAVDEPTLERVRAALAR